MATVELHGAFFWICDSCGRDNFNRGVSLPPEAIDPNILPEGVDAEEVRELAGSWMMAPDQVTCQHCGATFGVELV